MKKTVIWDFNGTILDDFALGLQTLNQMLERRGLPTVSASTYLGRFDFPVENFYRYVGFDFTRESFAELAAEYMAAYQPASFHCPLKTGVRKTLSGLQMLGISQVLLSATRHDFLVRQIRHFDLEAFFPQIHGMSDLFGRSKLELACGWLGENGHSPSDLLLVGDTVHDFAVAEALHCSCVLVAGGHNAKGRLTETGARVLDDLDGLLALVIET